MYGRAGWKSQEPLWVPMNKCINGPTGEKKRLGLITQIVFIKQLTAHGAHQTLYKGILLLQIEKYKIAPKAIQEICGYLDTTHVHQHTRTLCSPINTKLGGKGSHSLTSQRMVPFLKKKNQI